MSDTERRESTEELLKEVCDWPWRSTTFFLPDLSSLVRERLLWDREDLLLVSLVPLRDT